MRRLALALVCLVAASAPAAAHALTESTARVTLRDGYADVSAELDLFRLVAVPPTAVAVASDAEVDAVLAQLRTVLAQQVELRIDGVRQPLVLRGLPVAAQLRALAASLSAAGHDRGELVRIAFSAAGAVPGARAIALAMPAALGPTLVSFVQPAMQYTNPGAVAAFQVLVAAPAAPPPSPWWPWWGILLCVIAVLIAVSRMRRRRGRS